MHHALKSPFFPKNILEGIKFQPSPNPPEFAQPRLSRSNGGHPQRGGTNLAVFVPIWLVLPRSEAANSGVFDLCHLKFSPYSKGAVQIRVGLELAESCLKIPKIFLSKVFSQQLSGEELGT